MNDQYADIPQPQNINPYNNIWISDNKTTKPDVDKFFHDYNDKVREKFNRHWFERNDDDLIEGMKKVILSCQRDKYFLLKVLNFEVIKDYSEINRILYNYYDGKTKNGKKVDNPYDKTNLKSSAIMLLKVTYYIKLNIPEDKIRIDPKTGQTDPTEGIVEVLIELPIYVDKYYYKITGNYYIPITQMADGSIYNNGTSTNIKYQTITLKTQFMPIKVYKEYYQLTDLIDGESHKCVLYTSYIFTKKTDTIKFLLGRFGLYGAMEFLEIEGIYIQRNNGKQEILDPENFYNFNSNNKYFMISVFKRLFDKDNVTQSFVYTLCKLDDRLDHNKDNASIIIDIWDPRFWNRQLGADFLSATLDKGIPVLDSLESIYDLETKQAIRLPMEDKENAYCILRWMMREFSFLNQRENTDISTKHPRRADEYIPAIYARKLSTGIYRISDKGKNITFKDVVRVINTAPNYIIKNINASNLVEYVDLANDNDAELALAFTYKGISGLGDQGSEDSVPLIYRAVHPSHLGRVDLNTSSASDPGLSGIIAPMAPYYNGSFTDYVEPNSWSEFYQGALDELHTMTNYIEGVEFKKKLGINTFDYIKEDMVKETIATYKRLIPGVIDIEGKKDYTLGALIDVGEDAILIKSERDDEVGDITTSYEEDAS